MGDMADYYLQSYEGLYDIEDDADEPVWVTKDKRVTLIKDMDDKHLANTIRYLEWRGARTPEEVSQDPVAAVEAQMSRFGDDMQRKYMQLLAEKERRRAKVLASAR